MNKNGRVLLYCWKVAAEEHFAVIYMLNEKNVSSLQRLFWRETSRTWSHSITLCLKEMLGANVQKW